jgi:hypothetical protein
MHAQPPILPSTASPSRLLPARTVVAALLIGAAAAFGLASVTRAADPVAGMLDATGVTTETVAEALVPVVSATEPVLDAAGPVIATLEPAGALIQPTVGQIEPALDVVPSVAESTPLADALAPVLDAVAPIIDATGPLVRTVEPIVESFDELPPVPLGPTLPVLDGGASEITNPASAPSTATRVPPISAGDVAAAGEVRVGAPPSIPATFLPHPGSPVPAGRPAQSVEAVAAVAEPAVLALAGLSVGTAILLALLIQRPPSWRGWLPDALGPPSSRTPAVFVPPG